MELITCHFLTWLCNFSLCKLEVPCICVGGDLQDCIHVFKITLYSPGICNVFLNHLSTAALRTSYSILYSKLGLVFYLKILIHTTQMSTKTFTRSARNTAAWRTYSPGASSTRAEAGTCGVRGCRRGDYRRKRHRAPRVRWQRPGHFELLCEKRCSLRCACAKNDLTCTRKCHSSTNCNNKINIVMEAACIFKGGAWAGIIALGENCKVITFSCEQIVSSIIRARLVSLQEMFLACCLPRR